MREPSIHITKSVFMQIVEDMGISLTQGEIENIFRVARRYALSSRSVLKGNNQKNRRKLASIAKSELGDAQLLADIIYATRIKMHHTGVTKIKQNDSQWSRLKEFVPRINDFCERFNMPKREGYITLVSKGLKMLQDTKKKAPTNVISYLDLNFDKLINTMQAERTLQQDESPESTQEIYNIYCNHILDMTGIPVNYRSNMEEYIHFYNAKLLADSLGIDYETYIEAQFNALAFCNGIPKIQDLYGEKAQQRLLKYMSENNLSLSVKPSQSSKVDWSKFKQ